ncbi:hypothetical protein L598_001700000470 [Mesorhizobium sp. J18]|uniref:hypothetical protein n=1 Tax=Mesorhizobium sp. J18 TaxID=935263 RepID=UPI00119A1B28|nr:hypothetical protein [Mesorhizobium sp. J18]TWG98953.1 hypothetical protein L598_001700000470 [Mesorhizobium sp. J18]
MRIVRVLLLLCLMAGFASPALAAFRAGEPLPPPPCSGAAHERECPDFTAPRPYGQRGPSAADNQQCLPLAIETRNASLSRNFREAVVSYVTAAARPYASLTYPIDKPPEA